MQHAVASSHAVIELATFEDIPELLPLLRRFSMSASEKYSLYPETDEVATTILERLVYSHPCFVARRNGKVIGCIAGLLSAHLFNPRIRILTEAFWWVEPQYRSSRAGLLLLEALMTWAKQYADMFVMTLEHNSPVKPETLLKRGFKLRETNFILED